MHWSAVMSRTVRPLCPLRELAVRMACLQRTAYTSSINDVTIALVGLVMVLHVEGINRRLRINFSNRDVVCAVADLHCATQSAVVTTHVGYQHVPDLSSIAAATADRDRVTN